ncbi:hypothetical protein [Vibrio sp. TBV020]|uniref:hypothetical protein n=1 Tax=Vibrio sp. TBV020 TaxID=3137398 RepID=UPI0038CD9499
MNMAWVILVSICLMVLHFTYKQVWVKTRQLATQRQLLALQTQLRETLVEIEPQSDEKTLNTILMIDDGLSRAIESVDKLSLSYYLGYWSQAQGVQSQVDRDRAANFRRRLHDADMQCLYEMVDHANDLLYQQLKCNALLAILSLAPFALLFWFAVLFIDAMKRTHKKALQKMKVDMFWQIQKGTSFPTLS